VGNIYFYALIKIEEQKNHIQTGGIKGIGNAKGNKADTLLLTANLKATSTTLKQNRSR
jgi:hypothetical protein